MEEKVHSRPDQWQCWVACAHASATVSTKDQWQKVDGRHVHWVLPRQPETAVRYSIVLFRNKGAATEIFYHSDAAKPK